MLERKLVGFIVDNLYGFPFTVLEVCGEEEREGGFSAATFAGKETERFHDVKSLKSE